MKICFIKFFILNQLENLKISNIFSIHSLKMLKFAIKLSDNSMRKFFLFSRSESNARIKNILFIDNLKNEFVFNLVKKKTNNTFYCIKNRVGFRLEKLDFEILFSISK